MTTLRAHGIDAPLPGGLEGRIFVRPADGPGTSRPIAQFATFALPGYVADFGGSAVELMGPDDIFTVLFEYGPGGLGRALFAHQGMPRSLGPDAFKPYQLRRGIPGQSGSQWFFTE